VHPRFRQNMFTGGPWKLGSVVPEINSLAYIGEGQQPQVANASDPYLNTSHALFKTTQQLISVRKSCRELAEGELYFRAVNGQSADQGGGLIAFSRIKDGNESVVLVNAKGSGTPISKILIDSGLGSDDVGKKFVNLMDTNQTATVSDGGKFLDFGGREIGSTRAAIYVLESRVLKQGENFAICK
jgi:hypothetical protein